MEMFICFSPLMSRNKKSKGFFKASDCSKKRSSKSKRRVKPNIDIVSSSTENDGSRFVVSKSFSSSKGKISSASPKVLITDCLARAESTGETAYEGGDEHDGIRSMKRDQPKGQLNCHERSNPNLNINFLKLLETTAPQRSVSVIASKSSISPKVIINDSLARAESIGEVAYEGGDEHDEIRSTKRDQTVGELTFPVRSKSNLDIDSLNLCNPRTIQRLVSVLSASKSSISHKVLISNSLPRAKSTGEAAYAGGYEHDVLPTKRDQNIVELTCNDRSNPNLNVNSLNVNESRDFQSLLSVLSVSNQRDRYMCDTHEPVQKLDNSMMPIVAENQWVAFSLGTSHIDRVSSWVNSLDDCSFYDVDVEEHYDEIENEQTADQHHMESRTPVKDYSCTDFHATDEVPQSKNIIQSINSFSSAVHFPSIGLKVIPSISAFVSLRSVNLSGNCIGHITVGSLPKSLHTLDLSQNSISTIEGLRDLESLRILNLSHNRISKIGYGLSNCALIKELHLAGNKIGDTEGFDHLLKLTVLELSFNNITAAKALGHLAANSNSLLTLNLIGNPVQANLGDDQLKMAVLKLLPHIAYLNKQHINPNTECEVVKNPRAKAALRDVGRSPQRKATRRLSQGSSSSNKSSNGDASLRAIRHRSKSRLSTSGKKKAH